MIKDTQLQDQACSRSYEEWWAFGGGSHGRHARENAGGWTARAPPTQVLSTEAGSPFGEGSLLTGTEDSVHLISMSLGQGGPNPTSGTETKRVCSNYVNCCLSCRGWGGRDSRGTWEIPPLHLPALQPGRPKEGAARP